MQPIGSASGSQEKIIEQTFAKTAPDFRPENVQSSTPPPLGDRVIQVVGKRTADQDDPVTSQGKQKRKCLAGPSEQDNASNDPLSHQSTTELGKRTADQDDSICSQKAHKHRRNETFAILKEDIMQKAKEGNIKWLLENKDKLPYDRDFWTNICTIVADYDTNNSGSLTLPIHVAAILNLFDIVKSLFDDSTNVNAATLNGLTPLHFAARYGYKEVVEILLKAKAKVGVTTSAGGTPLHFAAQFGHKEVVEILLKAKAKVDVTTSNGSTPLLLAAEQGNTELTEIFLEKSQDLENPQTNPLKVAFEYIKANPESKIIDSIVKYININRRIGNEQSTILHLAAKGGHLQIVKTLLENHNAYINSTNRDHKTPLCLSMENIAQAQDEKKEEARRTFIYLLEQENIDLTCTIGGESMLFMAAIAKDDACVRLLIAKLIEQGKRSWIDNEIKRILIEDEANFIRERIPAPKGAGI